MDASVGKWFIDILNAINEINSFFETFPRKFADYSGNILLKRAIERNLEIIGEAVNRIIHKQPDIQITSARQIIQLRNLVIHSYDSISDENIWAVVINHLPKLKSEIQNLVIENFPDFPLIP